MRYLTSSFSLQMLPQGGTVEILRSPALSIKEWVDEIIVGHEGTAQELSKLLGFKVMVDRRPITLQVGDELLVAMPVNDRLVSGREIQFPELAYFYLQVKPPHKCPTLTSYWTEELQAELAGRNKEK